MKIVRPLHILCALLISIGALAQTVDNQIDTPAQSESAVAPAAPLDDFTRMLSEADSLAFTAKVATTHLHPEGRSTEIIEYTFSIDHPDHFAMTMKLQNEELRVIIKGKDMMMALSSSKEYVQCDRPKRLDTFIGWLTQEPVFRHLLTRTPFSDWDGPAKSIITDPETLTYQFEFELADLTLWMNPVPDSCPVPKRLFADMSKGSNHAPGSFTTEIILNDWQLGGTIPDASFELTPPEGFTQVEWFDSVGNGDGPKLYSLEKMIGAQAPPFKL